METSMMPATTDYEIYDQRKPSVIPSQSRISIVNVYIWLLWLARDFVFFVGSFDVIISTWATSLWSNFMQEFFFKLALTAYYLNDVRCVTICFIQNHRARKPSTAI